jgi:tRNA(Ile)-lysidine synthase
MPDRIHQLITQASEILPPELWRGFPILVAVSGGPDSVALLRVLTAMKELHSPKSSLIVAHINHQTRGVHSDADERFVDELATELKLDFRLHRINRLSDARKDPSEESMRDLRYAALVKIAHDNGARYIATGHTRDDQIETILFRLFRGTALKGLAGIQPLRLIDETISVVRPLLETTREQIEACLAELNQSSRADNSNSDEKYTRNFLRHRLLPEAQKHFGNSIGDAIIRLGVHAHEAQSFISQQANGLTACLLVQNPDRVEINTECLAQQPTILVRQFLCQIWDEQHWSQQSMTHQWWQKISKTIQAAPQQTTIVLNLPHDIRCEKTSQRMTFSRFTP